MRSILLLLISGAALLSGGLTQAAAAQTPPDPLAGDSRVNAKHSLRCFNTPLRDFLADLNVQTGIRFFADSRVADDRLTLITHDRPLRETLKTVAAFFDLEWKREGTAGDFGYTLQEGGGAAQRGQERRNARLSALADRLKEEAEDFAQIHAMSDSERDALETGLPQQIAEEKDPARRRRLLVRQAVLQTWIQRNRWRLILYRLITHLPPQELAALCRAATTLYEWPAEGSRALPELILADIRRAYVQENGLINVPDREIVSVRLRFTLIETRQLSLRWELAVGHSSAYMARRYNVSGTIPAGLAAAPIDPVSDAHVAPANWQNDPAFTVPVSVQVVPEDRDGSTAVVTDLFWLSDALDRLDRANPMNVIADAYWSTRIAGIDLKNVPLGEALSRLARMTGHHWWKQDGFLMVKSLYFLADRTAEPPSTRVATWKGKIEQGLFTLDDYADLTFLSEAQAQTLQEMMMRGDFPTLSSSFTSMRSHLLLWNALSRPQRRKVGGKGVVYSELNPAQQRLFRLAVMDFTPAYSSALPGEKQITKLRLRLETREYPCWGVRRGGAAATWRVARTQDPENSPSRDEALRRFQQLDSSIRLKEVQPMTLVTQTFLYESDNILVARAALSLPPRWESAASLKTSGNE